MSFLHVSTRYHSGGEVGTRLSASIHVKPRAPMSQGHPDTKDHSPLTFNFPSSANSLASDTSSKGTNFGGDIENQHPTVSSDSKMITDPPTGLAQRQMRRFAKSADKRQSVHMLGSIEHLQHHFVSWQGEAVCLAQLTCRPPEKLQLKFGLAAKEA